MSHKTIKTLTSTWQPFLFKGNFIVIITQFCLFHYTPHIISIFKNTIQSRFGKQRKQSLISFIVCLISFVQSCMTVTILMYNKFYSRNLIRREGDDAMVLIITLPFFSQPWPFCHGPVMIFTGRRPLYKGFSLFHPLQASQPMF